MTVANDMQPAADRESGSVTRRALLQASGGMVASHAASASAVAPARVQLRLLGTSDLHMFIDAYDYYHARPDPTVGLAKVAGLIRTARAEAANSLLFDNGDMIQGNPLGDYMARAWSEPAAEPGIGAVHPMFRAMNLLGYDAGTLGNHEFNYGLAFLDRALTGAAFPVVCANVDHADGRSYVPRSVVLERELRAADGAAHRLRIGVIGFVTPQITVWDKANLEGHVTTSGIVAAAAREVPTLRSRCDLLVALCHSGISTAPATGNDENAAFHLASVPGIDVIFTGHTHRVFPGADYAGLRGVDSVRGTLNGVPAVMPGYWGSHLGVIDLDLRRDEAGFWSVGGSTVEARPTSRHAGGHLTPLVESDPAVCAAVEPEHAATIAWVAQPAGKLARPITSFFALAGDDAVVSLVNDAQRWYARALLAGTPLADLPLLSAAAPFKAGGFSPQNFVDLRAGTIAIRDVADLYAYPNTLCIVRMTGAGLREWLERSAAVFNQVDPARSEPQALIDARVPSYNFDVIAGLNWRIDLTQPARYSAEGVIVHSNAHRILDFRLGGEPIGSAREFLVVTNNYRADGGGRFPGLRGGDEVVVRAPDTNRDAILRYIRQSGEIDPPHGAAWSFAPLGRATTVVFNSAAEAADLPPGVRRLGPAARGFARFAIDLA